MSKILISGLVNVEITCSIGKFPIIYQPIDYNFFGNNMEVSGVGYNVARALTTLGDDVNVTTLLGDDLSSELVQARLGTIVMDSELLCKDLSQTPLSVVLYDEEGKRRIYCDLKDIQDKEYDYTNVDISEYDIAVVCNINFSRPLLKKAKEAGVKIFTDVHVLGDLEDEYNKDFLENANAVFLSNEAVIGKEKEFVKEIAQKFHNEIIVMGCGSKGAVMYVRDEDKLYEMSAAKPEKVVNTVGAGDSLFSAFVSLYAKGCAPEECLEYAQKFAAYKIGFDGASRGFMTMEQLMQLSSSR